VAYTLAYTLTLDNHKSCTTLLSQSSSWKHSLSRMLEFWLRTLH